MANNTNFAADALRPFLSEMGFTFTEAPAEDDGAILFLMAMEGRHAVFDISVMLYPDGRYLFASLLFGKDFGGPIRERDLDGFRHEIDPNLRLSIHDDNLLILTIFHTSTDLHPSRQGLDIFRNILLTCMEVDNISQKLKARPLT